MKIALSAIVIAAAFALTGCTRLTEWRLVGTWRGENDDGAEELYLNPDHTFRSLETFKKELVTPSIIEETGNWRFKDGQIHLDGMVTWSKQPRNTTLRLIKLRMNELVIRGSEATMDASFVRFHVPTCTESLFPAERPITEKDLFGVWQVHWSTHDYEYSFDEDHSFSVAATSGDEHFDLDQHGIWKLSGNDLILRYEERPTNPSGDQHFTVLHGGKSCVTIKVADTPYVFVRLK